MSRPCCARGSAWRGVEAAASILPGALLVVLPKCPLCLAAWFGLAAGAGVSAAAGEWVRGAIVGIWVIATTLVTVRTVRNRAFRR